MICCKARTVFVMISCAFANTPKFNEVKAKSGKIVKEKWIEDCYAQKRLISWRKYIIIFTDLFNN